MSIALNTFLAPIKPYLEQEGVSEVCINRPGEIWVETREGFKCFEAPELKKERLVQIAELIAENNSKELSEVKPWLSATLPDGERCQFVLPPACDKNQFICAIRKPSMLDLSLEDWKSRGAFDYVKKLGKKKKQGIYAELRKQYDAGNWDEVIRLAIKARLNIIISGGTSSAKTTMLNSCLKEISDTERLITIEGIREVRTRQPNVAHLVANEDEDNNAFSMLDLLKASLRLRPDRIFVSEIRNAEAYPFLRACISGHPGSLTTLHADTVEHALQQLCFMLGESPELRGADEIRLRGIIQSAVGLIVQMTRFDNDRVIEDVYLNEALL